MASEFIKNRIDLIHALIDDGQYADAVDIAKNLKLRIHDKAVLDKINEFEISCDNEWHKKLDSIDKSSVNPLDKTKPRIKAHAERAKNYLRFYDWLSKEYDI